ncbi:hypothetical protein C8F01DRAFT_1103127 [Mycena amicta]|nr:hypothetical protein C8F01DRAFT_1103127 [Mycena amicta]
MLLARVARPHLRRLVHTQASSSKPRNPSVRYLLGAGTVAAVALGEYSDNWSPRSSLSSTPKPEQPDFETFIRKRLAERRPLLVHTSSPSSSTAELETDRSQDTGAYNPETGEINWDCPCLGGMADGPCGPEFRAAFSCFIYSEHEPKGLDCVEKFQGMQSFYASEIADDEAAEAAMAAENDAASAQEKSAPPPDAVPTAEPSEVQRPDESTSSSSQQS